MEISIGDGLQSFGDSFTVGYNASNNIGYSKLLANTIGGTFTNRGVGSSMSTTAAKLSRQHLLPSRTMPVTFMAGLNDIRQAGLAAIPKLQGNLRSFLTDCFLSQVVPASQMVRVGTWTALPNSYGGKAYYNGGTPLYCNSNINASLTWNFSGDNVVIGAYRTNGTTGNYRDVNISIDNGTPVVFELHGNTNEIVTFDTMIISGLGDGAHTVKIMPTTTAAHTTVDYVGTLNKDMPPVLVSEIPHLLNWAQYSSIATLPICNEANLAIDAILAEFAEYPVQKIHTNSFYDEQSMCSSDGIHPTTAGHSAIFDAFMNEINLVQYADIPTWATRAVITADSTESTIDFTTLSIKFS
jgi:lysophospholipase L1-like esterase